MRSRISPLGMVVVALSVGLAGCQGEAGVPRDGSPVVSVDSDAFRKAQEQHAKKIQDDKAAEAKARSRSKVSVE